MAIKRFSSSNLSGGKSSKLWDQTTTPGYYESIATVVIDASGATDITFSNIPQTYTHLQLRLTTRGKTVGLTGACVHRLKFNGDSGANYTYHQLRGNGTGAGAESGSSLSAGCTIGYYPAGGETANTFGAIVCDILDYTNTSKYKVTRALDGWDGNGSGYSSLNSGLWMSSSAITSIFITCDDGVGQYSTVALYGIRGE